MTVSELLEQLADVYGGAEVLIAPAGQRLDEPASDCQVEVLFGRTFFIINGAKPAAAA